MRTFIIAASTISISTLVVPSLVGAEVIVSNFGADDSFDSSLIFPITGSDFVETIAGVPIITGATAYRVDAVQLALFADIFGSYAVNFQIRSDQDGIPSDNILASATFTEGVPGGSAIVTGHPTPSLRLEPHSTYWLVGTPVERNTYRGWFINNTVDLGYVYYSGQGWVVDSLSYAPVYRVTGTPVPEPTGALLICSCCAFIGHVRRR